MSDYYFVSYSSVDGAEFAVRLADALAAGPPSFPVWVDQQRLRPGKDWDEQIVQAIRGCRALLFVMTHDSVRSNSVCKHEWVQALRYKKPLVPLRLDADAELPFRLGSRQFVDFSGSFETGLAKLRRHLVWLGGPEGQLQALQDRLADAERERPRAEPPEWARIEADIDLLRPQTVGSRAEAGSHFLVYLSAGGTCRDPMATAITRKLIEERAPELKDIIRVEGRGLSPVSKSSVSFAARRAIEDIYGEDLLSTYVPKVLTQDELTRADLVLLMQHYELHKLEFPVDKTYVFKEFFGLNGTVADPWPDGKDSKTLARYLETAEEIKTILETRGNLDKVLKAMGVSRRLNSDARRH